MQHHMLLCTSVSSFNQAMFLHPNNSVEHWMSQTEKLASALQQFVCRKPSCRAILEKYRRCRLILYVAAIVVLFFSNEATLCISSWFYCQTIAFVICMTAFTGVKPSFLKCDLRFLSTLTSSAHNTEAWCLLFLCVAAVAVLLYSNKASKIITWN